MSVRADDRPAPPPPVGRRTIFPLNYSAIERSSTRLYDRRRAAPTMTACCPRTRSGPTAQEPAPRRPPAFTTPSSITSVVTGDGVLLSVRKSGSTTSPVIVFVHGFPDDAHVWSGVTAALAGEARLVTYDVRGAGSSGAPADRSAYGSIASPLIYATWSTR